MTHLFNHITDWLLVHPFAPSQALVTLAAVLVAVDLYSRRVRR